ncbi:MAG: ThiF family adenylyltransferase [Planctomycetes bacterium]|nr:ThiF family adenylyltransferase [Planctomycetota bacterium]
MAIEIKVLDKRGDDPEPSGSAPNAYGKIQIRGEDLVEDRYHRLRLIKWWDQELLANTTVVVAGAGALGNEAIKNLALLGVGRLIVCDMDGIETSNLTRSVLFRQHDVGRQKAEVACERAMEMNPDTVAIPVQGDLRYSIGLGVIRRSAVVLGCLDNIAARVYLSRHCYRLGKPSIDAGLDTVSCDVYTFTPPVSSCYECRLKEADRKEFRRRQSCLKLARDETGFGGKVPTSPTSAAIASGIQTQIAVRLIHGLRIPAGRRLGLYGISDVFFDYEIGISEDCPAHGWLECLEGQEIHETQLCAATSTLDELLGEIRARLGEGAILSLDGDREVIVGLSCAACDQRRDVLAVAGDLSEDDARCESCHEPMAPDLRSQFDGTEGLGHKTLAELGLPSLHIIKGVDAEGDQEQLFELTGDLSLFF